MSYVKIAVIGSGTPALVCLEDVSTIGGTMPYDIFSGSPKLIRIVSMRNGFSYVVTPDEAEKLEAQLLGKQTAEAEKREKEWTERAQASQNRCLCRCLRCSMFPGPHAKTHVDCCGRQARGECVVKWRTDPSASAGVAEESWHGNATAKRLDEACAVCGAPVFETPSGIVCRDGHGGEGVLP